MLNSIRFKFIVIYSLLITVIIITIATTFNITSNIVINNNALESSMRESKLEARILSDKIKFHTSNLLEAATELDIFKIKERDMVDSLAVMNEKNDYLFEHVFFSNIDGVSYRASGELGDVTDRDFFHKTISGDYDFYISNPVFGRFLNKPALHISVPVKYDGELVGILTGAIPIDNLLDELSVVGISDDSYGWLIDKEGKIIAHPHFEFLEKVDLDTMPIDLYNDGGEYFNRVLDLEEGIGFYKDNDSGINYAFTFTVVEGTDNWRLGITFVEKEIFSGASHMKMIIVFISAIILIVAIIITILLTSSIVSPVRQLKEAAKNKKDFEPKLNFLQNNSEITTMIKAYNNMRRELTYHSDNLEKLVEERTSELNEAYRKLSELASKDELTGAYNRTVLYETIENRIAEVKNNQIQSFAVLFIDIDNFKYYNDTFGHDVGDKILISLSDFFKQQIGSNDIVIRYGGDEFIVIMSNLDSENIKNIVKLMRKSVTEMDNFKEEIGEWLNINSLEIPKEKSLGVSIGHSIYNSESNLSAEELVKIADEDMYRMKTEKV